MKFDIVFFNRRSGNSANHFDIQKLAKETKFTVDELKLLRSEFLHCASGRMKYHDTTAHKPFSFLRTDLSPVEWLRMFGLSDALPFTFAERFFCLFWRRRNYLSDATITFDEFVHSLSLWSRGQLQDKLILLFRMYDAHDKGYVDAEDIYQFFQSLFLYYYKAGRFEWVSTEFQATVTIKDLTDNEISTLSTSVLREVANEAIREFHIGNDGKKLLWFDEFERWIVHQPGVLQHLLKSETTT